MTTIRITVNGEQIERDVPESRTLAAFLREDLGLTGTKIGCEEAECGICTVLVDGVPVNSCVYPLFKAQGADVLTIEGLAQGDDLHPLQRAFVEHGAVQCGFCTPGLIMTAKALLDNNPAPDEQAISAALKDTYCRCTGYTSVIRAVQSAASELRGEGPLPYPAPETVEPLRVVGRSLPRPEEAAKVTGHARFTDDLAFPGMLYGRTRRSDYPHARILSIDTSAAKALPGVAAVLTHEDIPGENIHGLVFPDWPCLAADKVRYTGDPIAIVAAETPEIAAQAVALIRVEYEPLPVVNDPLAAHAPDAPLVHEEWPTGNLLKHIAVQRGDVARGRAEAEVIVERTYRTPTTEHAFLEPECSIAVPAGYTGHPLPSSPPTSGRRPDSPPPCKGEGQGEGVFPKLTVYCGSQIPYSDRAQVARILGLPEDQVRIRGMLIGGGFGGKEDLAAQAHAALLAQATGRPVKMLFSRSESLIYHPKRHATVIHIAIGAKRDGTLTFVEAELHGDSGAYASLSDKVLARATTHASGPYDVPHAKIDCYAMTTNNPPAGAFRGFGVTQSAFAVESTMDALAAELGMDPFELRRRNALRVGSTTVTGQVLRESVGLVETIDRVRGALHDEGFRWAWREGSRAYGWGLACAYKNSGLGGGANDASTVEVEAYEDGTVEARCSAADLGQGLAMVIAQLAAEEMGLPYERVRVLLSDTDLTPDGGPTTASRQTFVTGNATRLAAATLREALRSVVAEQRNTAPERIHFEEGRVHLDGEAVSLGTVVGWMKQQGLKPVARYEYTAPETKPLGEGSDMHFAFSYATQAALVEVDLDTGEVRVLRVISSTDVGRAINPRSVQGQLEGGIVMALGNCLTEEYIIEDGVPWTTLFARYKIPSIRHTPQIDSTLVEHPVAAGPYGAKGIGELASIPTTPAICNAIFNATGVRVLSTPVDQDALLRAIRAGQAEISTTWHDVR